MVKPVGDTLRTVRRRAINFPAPAQRQFRRRLDVELHAERRAGFVRNSLKEKICSFMHDVIIRELAEFDLLPAVADAVREIFREQHRVGFRRPAKRWN